MTPIHQILSTAQPVEGGFRTEIPSDWLQGRTAYGGLSSALALHAAQGIEPDLPPLRSAQVSFIGPLSGDITVTATKLRRGRTAAFIQADITSDAGLGYRATFVFMDGHPSRVDLQGALRKPLPPPAPDATLYTGPDEFFTGNFNFLDLKQDGDRELGAAEWLRWARLRDHAGIDPMVELMAIGDALPPAAFKLFGKDFVPLSSLTWIVNLLTPTPRTTDGWWLLSARTDHAVAGGSSQTMMVWNADGEPVAQAMQSVAIFG